VQIERNRGQLGATQIAVEHRIPLGTPGSLRLGAGRSQVQILSPRLKVPAHCIIPTDRVMSSRGPIWPLGSKFLPLSGKRVYGATPSLAGGCSHPVRSHRIDQIRTTQLEFLRWLFTGPPRRLGWCCPQFRETGQTLVIHNPDRLRDGLQNRGEEILRANVPATEIGQGTGYRAHTSLTLGRRNRQDLLHVRSVTPCCASGDSDT
jgi:hypothetical protein